MMTMAQEKFLTPEWIQQFKYSIRSAPVLMIDANLNLSALKASCQCNSTILYTQNSHPHIHTHLIYNIHTCIYMYAVIIGSFLGSKVITNFFVLLFQMFIFSLNLGFFQWQQNLKFQCGLSLYR